MLFYFAPLEGITNSVYHNAYHSFFRPLDKCITPFFIPNEHKGLSKKDQTELSRHANQDTSLVPQLLTNHSVPFIKACDTIKELNYPEVNLNLGCPSGTVVAKRRGSGFLSDLDALESFFDEVFSKVSLRISIKTRIGIHNPEEFEEILQLYEKFPISELIIHPRIRDDFYRNEPNMDIFATALSNSSHPIVYSGDLFSAKQINTFKEQFPKTHGMMLGRGMIANPGLFEHAVDNTPLTLPRLQAFYEHLYAQYRETLFGPKPVLYKMKELWHYMIHLFEDHEKQAKRLRKSQTLSAYDASVSAIFRDLHFNPNAFFVPPHKK